LLGGNEESDQFDGPLNMPSAHQNRAKRQKHDFRCNLKTTCTGDHPDHLETDNKWAD